MMRDERIDAAAKKLVGGPLKAREALCGLDVVSADTLSILVYEARHLNAREEPEGEQYESEICSQHCYNLLCTRNACVTVRILIAALDMPLETQRPTTSHDF